MQMLQPVPLLARLIPESGQMMLGPNILVMPVLNPVLVAEEAATIDVMSGGRYILGVGLGYRDEEFEMAGIKKSSRVSRFTEGLDIVRQIWSQDMVTFEGQHYKLSNIGTSLKPLQKNGCPIWIAAVVDKAIERAALIGDVWLSTFYPTRDTLTRQMDLYRSVRKESGLAEATDYPVLRECYVGADTETALQECQASLQYKYAAYHSWGQDKILSDEDRFDQPFDEFKENRFIIGDVDHVRDELQRYRDEIGVDHFVMRMQWPGLAQDLVLRSIDRLAEAAARVR